MLRTLAAILALLTLTVNAQVAAPAADASASAASAPAPAAAPAGAADQAALRKLKVDITTAISTRDFDATEKVLHKPFMATLITQEAFTTVPQLKQYYDYVLNRATPRLKDMSLAAEVDGDSIVTNGTFAVNKGSTLERYVLEDGRAFDMKGRWTSVSLRQPDGSWKLMAVHTGVNFLDNPVIHAIEQSILWIAVAVGVVCLLLGGALGWLLKGVRARRQAAARA
jgi:ketosteroid isomerase-like protein